jgi:cytochrome P450
MAPQTAVSEGEGRAFDLLDAGDAFREDPYPTYRWLRDAAPVHRNPDGSYVVTRHADVDRVLVSPDMTTDKSVELRRAMGEGPILEYHLSAMVSWDPPRHTRIRRALAKAFTPRAMVKWEPFVRESVDELLSDAGQGGEMDLVGDFAAALPLTLICKMLGVPKTEKDRFRSWARSITTSLDPGVGPEVIAEANRHSEEWKAYFRNLIALRRREPGEDLVSMLLATDETDEPFSELALLHNLALLLSAGHETTTSLITNAVEACRNYPEEADRLRRQPELFESAVEEFLRFESPVQLGARRTTAAVTLSGVTIPPGQLIWTVQGAANRDEREFPDPDRLDVGRTPNRHLAFATGIHVCLGAPLARLEAKVALERLICDYPKLRLCGTPERFLRTRYRGFLRYAIALR